MALDAYSPAMGKVSDILARAGAVSPAAVPSVLGQAPGRTADVPGLFVSDRRLYLTEDGEVVEEGDEAGVFLLVGVGGMLTQAVADELGVKTNKKKAQAAKDALPVADPITVIANPIDPVPVPEGVNTVAPAVPAAPDAPTVLGGPGASATALGTPAAVPATVSTPL